jgi:hypothetical protein
MNAQSLEIIHQSSLFKERTLSNGQDFCVNYIVRKTPFQIELQSGFSFFEAQKLDCSLRYHLTEKTVESNSGPALEYVCNYLDSPTTCAVSFRINVLSTQHSNSNFVIRFAFGNEVVFSEPIRSVSKPEQIRKKLAQYGGDEDERADETKPSTKKRARSEELIAMLTNIHHSQLEQTALITSLLNPIAYNNRPANLVDNLAALITNFEEEDVEQRPTKIGRFICALDDDNKKALASLGRFLVNLTEPTHSQLTLPPLPFTTTPMENFNVIGEELSSDGYPADGVNEEVYFPESHLNWLNF